MNYFLKNCAVFIAPLLVDQITKNYALKHFVVPEKINSFLTFELHFNKGTSWGMFNSTEYFVPITILVAAVAGLLAWYILKKAEAREPIYAELFVLSGAFSNIIDRIMHAGVVDFITVHLGAWSWPTFNIADACIVLGVFWMLLSSE